jgi:hypothetical protein
MKRFYVSPIIGDGSEFDPFRAKIQDYSVNHVAVIPSGADGKPLYSWALVIVAEKDHGKLLADNTIQALPDFPFDAKVSAMQTATKNMMTAKLKNRGIATDFIISTDGYRDVIRGIGRQLVPDFDENSFDIGK